MTDVRVIPVVEGDGECDAVPVLIRRIALDIDPGFVPHILNPLRVPVAKLKKPEELDRTIKLAALKLQGAGGVFILVDCDDGCPAQEGPDLLAMAQRVRPDSALLGFDEAFRYFVQQEKPAWSKEDLNLPVRIEKGCWQILIPAGLEAVSGSLF